MPSLKYENSVSDGIKIGTITLGEQSFDVYAPSSSAGGSTVSVVPKTLTGTNIAEITVDGTTYQLYAPTSGGGSGSTVTAEATLTEGTQIGKITIDGVETILYAPTASTITVDAELSVTSENPVQNKVVKAEFDKVNSNLSDLKVSDVAGGKNLFKNYDHYGSYRVVDETYNDNGVIYSANLWDGAYQSDLILKKGKTYAISAYVKGSGKYYVFCNQVDNNSLATIISAKPLNDEWTKITQVFTPVSDINRVRFENETTGGLYISCFQIEEGTQATDYEPYIPSVKMIAEENTQQNDSLSALGKCKNLLKPTLQTTTQNDVTCTNNGDGTYTLNGTATAEIDVLIGHTIKTFKKNTKLKIAGMPTTGKAFVYDSFNSLGAQSFAYGFEGKEYQTKSEGSRSNCNLHIPSGTSLPNVIIRPMIVENLNATYDDFVPYTGDGDTLTADVAKINSDVSDLKDGTTPVAKAVADEDGNNIKSTYAKKTETFGTVTEDVNVVLNSDLFDSTYSDITCVRIGKLCVLSFTIRASKAISSTIDKIVLMSIIGTKYQPKKLGASTGRRQIFQGFAVGNYDENGKQSQSLNNTVRIITDWDNNYTEIITRDKDRLNWSGYVQGQIMWVTD